MRQQTHQRRHHNRPIRSGKFDDFERVFQDEVATDSLKFSQHAQKRMFERNIHLDDYDKMALSHAVTEMISKGSRDCLIMYKETGFITSLSQRTIVTAIDHVDLKEITNIDSVKFVTEQLD